MKVRIRQVAQFDIGVGWQVEVINARPHVNTLAPHQRPFSLTELVGVYQSHDTAIMAGLAELSRIEQNVAEYRRRIVRRDWRV